MKITQRQLRQIIKEELERSMDETDLQLAVPYIARKRKKQNPAPAQAPLGPMPDHMRDAQNDRIQLRYALGILSKDLSEIDAGYVQDILPTGGGRSPYTYIVEWAGPELQREIEELAKDYLKSYNGEILKTATRDPEAAFEKFQKIVNQYAPMRGRQDFLGTASRFAAGFGQTSGLTPKTSESFKRR